MNKTKNLNSTNSPPPTNTITANSQISISANNGDLTQFLEIVPSLVESTEVRPPVQTNDDVTRLKIEYATEIGKIVTKTRLTNGFNPYSPGDQTKAVETWFEIFIFEKIPIDAINGLFLRARSARMKVIAEKGDAPKLDCDFILAQWIGGVRDEYYSKRSKAKIANSPVVGCPDCFGNSTGRKYIDGRLSKEICLHENLLQD